MKFLVIAAVLSVAHCANNMCWDLDQITAELVRLADTNQDGILQHDELIAELMVDWNLSNDSCLSFHDFTTNWIENFHDHHDTAHAFFDNLDINGDGRLCLLDVAVQILMYDQKPADAQIQPEEFSDFMHAVHPDSHQNGGQGHGC